MDSSVHEANIAQAFEYDDHRRLTTMLFKQRVHRVSWASRMLQTIELEELARNLFSKVT